jgi:hypothetical protein
MAPSGRSPYRPPDHALRLGSRGPAVKRMQRRLRALKYQPGRADGVLGPETLAAVWAFERVQGVKIDARNAGTVSRRVLRMLVHPRLPKVFEPHGGHNLRVEVDLADQILVLYHHNKIELITHISSGGGYYFCNPGGGCGYAVTPTGSYRFLSYAPGWIQVPLGEMYNSSFFIGQAYAVHGDTYVPWYPASHGCIRIPMPVAAYFHKLIHFPGGRYQRGTPIYVNKG